VFVVVVADVVPVAVAAVSSLADAVARERSLERAAVAKSMESVPEASIVEVGRERSVENTEVAESVGKPALPLNTEDGEARPVSLAALESVADADTAEAAGSTDTTEDPERGELEASTAAEVEDTALPSDKRLNASCTLMVVVLTTLAELAESADGADWGTGAAPTNTITEERIVKRCMLKGTKKRKKLMK